MSTAPSRPVTEEQDWDAEAWLQVQHRFVMPFNSRTKCGLTMKPRTEVAHLPVCLICYAPTRRT